MTPDELATLEADLKRREEAITTREAALARQDADTGTETPPAASPATSPNPNTANTQPPPSTFVHSIKTYVPITLDLQASNHAQWRELFLVALGRYGLTNHVIGDESGPSDTSPTYPWGCDDYTILNWIYGSISPELFSTIMKPGSSARQIWAAIDNLFRDNKKSRAIALEADFRNTPQDDMMVHDYCAKLKSLADALAALINQSPTRPSSSPFSVDLTSNFRICAPFFRFRSRSPASSRHDRRSSSRRRRKRRPPRTPPPPLCGPAATASCPTEVEHLHRMGVVAALPIHVLPLHQDLHKAKARASTTGAAVAASPTTEAVAVAGVVADATNRGCTIHGPAFRHGLNSSSSSIHLWPRGSHALAPAVGAPQVCLVLAPALHKHMRPTAPSSTSTASARLHLLPPTVDHRSTSTPRS